MKLNEIQTILDVIINECAGDLDDIKAEDKSLNSFNTDKVAKVLAILSMYCNSVDEVMIAKNALTLEILKRANL